MNEEEIREYAKSRGIHPQTLRRWLAWQAADRDALFRLVLDLKLGENNIRDLLDWLEEIEVRDSTPVREILARRDIYDALTDPRLGRADKVKRAKEHLRRLRYPRLAGIEDAIAERIRGLKLPAAVRLSVPPGLEGGTLRVEFNSASAAELKMIALRLADAADQESVREVFDLLSGDGCQNDPASHP